MKFKDVNNIDVNDLETFGTVLRDCICKELQFENRGHGHVITGDLRFIKNKHLRNLISKESNFREARTSTGVDAKMFQQGNRTL